MQHARPVVFVAAALVTLAPAACSSPKGDSVNERRDYVRDEAARTLERLYTERPSTRGQIASAAGHGVFSTIGTNLILVSTGGGFGVVYDDEGNETFMRMGEVGVGLGLGVKDFRAVFVFETEEAVEEFVENGWAFGADADAAAKTGDTGGAVGAKGDISSEITVYQLTENGLALSATVAGTKYWKDDDLN